MPNAFAEREQGGQALVEFALSAMVLVFFMLGGMLILDVTRLKLATIDAAREMSRRVVNDRCRQGDAEAAGKEILDETPLIAVAAFTVRSQSQTTFELKPDALGLNKQLIAHAGYTLETTGLFHQIAPATIVIESTSGVLTKSRTGLIFDTEVNLLCP